MPNGNTAGAERQYRAMDGAVPNRDTEGANRRDYSGLRCEDEVAREGNAGEGSLGVMDAVGEGGPIEVAAVS